MKFYKKIINALSVTAITALAMCSAACTNGEKLNKAQTKKLENIIEAVYESKIDFSAGSALDFRDLEMFVYYMSNDEVSPVKDGYGELAADKADALCQEVIGIKPSLRYHYNFENDVLFYFSDDKYYIKPNESAIRNMEIVSCETNEEGRKVLVVNVDGVDGEQCVMDVVVELNGNSVKLISCTRKDYK